MSTSRVSSRKPWTDKGSRFGLPEREVTMGCGDACPIFPGKRYEEWVLDDPAGRGVDDVRAASATRSSGACARLLDELNVPVGWSANKWR